MLTRRQFNQSVIAAAIAAPAAAIDGKPIAPPHNPAKVKSIYFRADGTVLVELLGSDAVTYQSDTAFAAEYPHVEVTGYIQIAEYRTGPIVDMKSRLESCRLTLDCSG